MEIFNEYLRLKAQIIKSGNSLPIEFDCKMQLKLLNIFMVGNYYYFILDIATFKVNFFK